MKEYVLNNPPLWHIVHICTLDIWLSEKNKNSIKLCQVHTLLQINYLAINQSSLVFKYFRVRWSCNILKYKYKILQLKKKNHFVHHYTTIHTSIFPSNNLGIVPYKNRTKIRWWYFCLHILLYILLTPAIKRTIPIYYRPVNFFVNW